MQLTVQGANAQAGNNLEMNLTTRIGQYDQRHCCTGDDVTTQVASETITQSELSSSPLSGECTFSYRIDI